MEGSDLLPVAEELARGNSEPHWRSAAGRAYYALFLESRELLRGWEFVIPSGHSVHAFVRLRFTYAADGDLHSVGLHMEDMVKWRNQADYVLASSLFLTDNKAWKALALARDCLKRLQVIDADPARR